MILAMYVKSWCTQTLNQENRRLVSRLLSKYRENKHRLAFAVSNHLLKNIDTHQTVITSNELLKHQARVKQQRRSGGCFAGFHNVESVEKRDANCMFKQLKQAKSRQHVTFVDFDKTRDMTRHMLPINVPSREKLPETHKSLREKKLDRKVDEYFGKYGYTAKNTSNYTSIWQELYGATILLVPVFTVGCQEVGVDKTGKKCSIF